MRIDLHVHSTYSDGIYAPSALVELAVGRGVSALSLADHDCVDGIEEARNAARDTGIAIISGVELSSEFQQKDLHILGYAFDENNDELKSMLERFRDTRHKRGLKIIENLKKMGVELDPREVLAKSADGALGRPHIAETLIENGFVSNHSEAFAKFLGEQSPAYVKKHKLSPQDAIKRIHQAGGLAFIAHPGNLLDNGIQDLMPFGFDGIEVVHPNHSNSDTEKLKSLADKYGLLMSGGTDYHGFSGRDIQIGELELPQALWEPLRKELGISG